MASLLGTCWFEGFIDLARNNKCFEITIKCDFNCCIKWNRALKPFTPNISYSATEVVQQVHLHICGPFKTVTGGIPYMLLLIVNATSHTHEYILKYTLEGLEKCKQWTTLRKKESGKQVKWLYTDGSCECTFKKVTKCLNSEEIIMQITTPYTP